MNSAPPKATIRPLAVIGTIAGVLLFIYTLQAAGPREILRQLRQIGPGFLVVLAPLRLSNGRACKSVVVVRRGRRDVHISPSVAGISHR